MESECSVSIQLIVLSDVLNLESINVNQNDDDDENIPQFEEWRYDMCRKLGKDLCKISYITDIQLNPFKMEYSNDIKDIKKCVYYDDGVCHIRGSMTCERKMNRNGVQKMLTLLCSNEKCERIWFSLNPEAFNDLFKFNYYYMNREFKYNVFRCGTIINLTTFVCHFDSKKYYYKEQELDSHWSISQNSSDQSVCFQHDRKRLIIMFRLKEGDGGRGSSGKSLRYRFEVTYSSINSIVAVPYENTIVDTKTRTKTRTKTVTLYLNLKHPPLIYVYEKDKINTKCDSGHGKKRKKVESYEIWNRESELPGVGYDIIGKSNVLALEISQIINKKHFDEITLKDPDPLSLLVDLRCFAKVPIHFANIKQINYKNKSVLPQIDNHHQFAVQYAFKAIFALNFQVSDELLYGVENGVVIFQEKVNRYAGEDPKAAEEALYELRAAIDRGSIVRSLRALDLLFAKKRRIKKIDLSLFKANIVEIRRCILTPSRMILLPPQPILKSRFVHNSEPDYAIRLSIREDNFELLGFSVRGTQNQQLEFLKKCVTDRITNSEEDSQFRIGNRLYEFLGSSTSQLRDNGMIMYARDSKGKTAEMIRQEMGDMSMIRKNVPKYVARLGLAFSQALSHVIIDLKSTNIKVIPDIEGNHKPIVNLKLSHNNNHQFIVKDEYSAEKYNFSDGIGMISQQLADEIYSKSLPLYNNIRYKPSAMQIRFRGCKGMLVIHPQSVNTNLNGKTIIFRESMQKYLSEDNTLGILKLSSPRPVYLNRYLIAILETLKVPKDVFLRMLMDNLRTLTNALVCECAAYPLISNYSTLRLPYNKIKESQLPILNEPFFRQILDSILRHNINQLKMKSRIRVPMHEGRILFGVLDETGILEYGQIFVQITVNNDDMKIEENIKINELQYEVLTGEVMVTKFPCMHPGDVRKFQAIDVPALNHIKDCIVFPAKGPRPHPDEMAGSDLDGDEYAIFWNSDLIFEGNNHSAMHFPSIKAEELDHDADVNDILDFYCQYIIADNVGKISYAYLANSDLYPDGIKDMKSQILAVKYAIALDFAKTGKPQRLESYERPYMYPDFMEKYDHRRTYLSKKILGQLYRQCCRFEMGITSKSENCDLKITLRPNPIFSKTEWKKYKSDATIAFNIYKERISYLMERFGIDNEPALLCGAYSKASKYLTGRTETNDVHELLETLVNNTFAHMKMIFQNQSKDDTDEEIELRACAWYMVTYEQNNNQISYFGFPWTITEYLCRVRSKYDKEDPNNHDCVKHSADIMDQYLHNNYLHRDPEKPDSMTFDVKAYRLEKVKLRAETAKIVLNAWLERQENLFVNKITQNKNIITVPSPMMADMDKRLRIIINKQNNELIEQVNDNPYYRIPSVGSIVMNFLKDLANEWLSGDTITIDINNHIVATPLIKFGYSALRALNHFFRTRQISHIVESKPKFEVSLPQRQFDATYHIPLLKFKHDKKLAQKTNDNVTNNNDMQNINEKRCFSEIMVQEIDNIRKELQKISGVSEIVMEWYKCPTKHFQFYILLTARGTIWEHSILKNIIAHPCFYRDIENFTLRTRNLILF